VYRSVLAVVDSVAAADLNALAICYFP
jgi:hypothetical protein